MSAQQRQQRAFIASVARQGGTLRADNRSISAYAGAESQNIALMNAAEWRSGVLSCEKCDSRFAGTISHLKGTLQMWKVEPVRTQH